MKQFSNCLGAVLATLFCACTDGRTLEPRTGEPKLTREHALARAARISEVAYGLEFELDGEAPEYAGRVEISFDLSDVHEDLTVDFVGGTVSHVNINGRVMVASPVGKDGDNAEFSDRLAVPYNGFFLNLPAQALQTGTNVVEIAFSHPYSSDSSGMYRFTDPVDGRVYLYTDFEPYDQNRLFPSFDQPDLKARYSTRVTVPAHWQVISVVSESGIVDQGDRKVWTFPRSAPAWPTLRTHRTQLGLYDFDNGNVGVRLRPVTYSGERTRVAVPPGEHCPDFIYANHGNWDYVRVDLDGAALSTLRSHLNDFDDPLVRSMLWQGVYEMVLYQRLPPAQFIDFALANIGSESLDEVARLALGAMQGAWSYVQLIAQDDVSTAQVAARIEEFLWQDFHGSEAGSDRQLLMFDNYVRAVTTGHGLERLAGLLDGISLPEGFVFDQDRRWNVLKRLNGFGYTGVERLLNSEQQRDQSDKGRRWAWQPHIRTRNNSAD